MGWPDGVLPVTDPLKEDPALNVGLAPGPAGAAGEVLAAAGFGNWTLLIFTLN